jgi:hypothetical protein
VSGATPTVKDQGTVSAGNYTYFLFPSIDINANGDIGRDYSIPSAHAERMPRRLIPGEIQSTASESFGKEGCRARHLISVER